jgi:hypothetical protein
MTKHTCRPANSKPSICSRAILASSGRLYLQHLLVWTMTLGADILDEAIAFTATCRGIAVEVDKVKFTKGFEDLLDVVLGQVEMQRTDI